MNCSAIACVAHDPSVDNSPAEHPHLQHSTHCPSGQSAHNKKPARNRCVAVPSRLVVCARWCPTLPHPGGCSTIGAVRLSFRVRDGCRAFPCRCDHRDGCWQCCVVPSCVLLIRLCVAAPPTATHPGVGVVGGWVGCGPYSGRFAVNCSLPPVPFCSLPAVLVAGGWVWGVLFVSAY